MCRCSTWTRGDAELPAHRVRQHPGVDEQIPEDSRRVHRRPGQRPAGRRDQQARRGEGPDAYTTISKQTAAIMATGTFPLSVTAVALGRVGDLMQEEHGLEPSVNVTALAREMTAR